MSAMVQEVNWDTVTREEGDAIVELSAESAEEASGGWWWFVGAALLLWPTRLY